jgi:AraC-like DNA-binding protein
MRTPDRSPPRAEILAVDVGTLEVLFDQMPDVAFFVKDIEGRYRTVNDSLVARHGLSTKDQALGKQPRDICPGQYGVLPSKQDSVVLSTGQPLLNHLEMHWYTPHEPGWCLTTKLPLRDAGGSIVGLVGVSRDLRSPVNPRNIPSRVADVLNEFETDPGRPATASTLARAAGITASRFARLMKRFFGMTPTQYITRVRVATATRLLHETQRPVTEIAQACGFYDHSAFARIVRQITGLTPTQIRRES